MSKLTTKARNKLPLTSFGLPSRRAFPINDRAHADNAKARAAQQVKAGNLSKGQQAKIDAKADRKLGKSKK